MSLRYNLSFKNGTHLNMDCYFTIYLPEASPENMYVKSSAHLPQGKTERSFCEQSAREDLMINSVQYYYQKSIFLTFSKMKNKTKIWKENKSERMENIERNRITGY
ncbi:hypothetical protein JTB14_027590 [Gonioctena quinquepunctata]|nr:hypothetical protein JTB14_027590 [Gonioctena quinquepunctata]